MPRIAHRVALPLTLATSTTAPEGPLRHRIADAIIAAVGAGTLRPGDALPSTRMLAGDLGVSRGAVVAAYDELTAAGFIVGRPGSGTVVADGADRAAVAGAASHVPPGAASHTPPGAASHTPADAVGRPSRDPAAASAPQWDLRPGRPDTGLLERAAWRRAWRRAAEAVPGNDAGAGPEHTALRIALADHLRRSRGVRLDPDDILITPGVAASLHALPAAFDLVGAPVALEDPGYVEAWSAFERAGVAVRAVPVDDDGLDPRRLRPDDRGVYVTPSHQYPLGGRMPVTRRAELLTWASDSGGLVIEDDYDGEFRYGVSPLPALRSLPGAAEHVVYIGTASKLIAPSLRISWIVPPRRLRDRLRVELEVRGLVVNEPSGLALAEFITSGALGTHHARASRTYASRRAALVTALASQLPEVAVVGVDAGLHVVLRLPDEVDDLALVSRLERAGLALSPLSAYTVTVGASGLVACYAALPERQAAGAVQVLASVLRSFTPSR